MLNNSHEKYTSTRFRILSLVLVYNEDHMVQRLQREYYPSRPCWSYFLTNTLAPDRLYRVPFCSGQLSNFNLTGPRL